MPIPKSLGVLRPLGGGDPIELKREELIVGRRRNCDIHLDYENVSGKHCQLRYVRGTWHVRDLNSTNGTTKNGQKIHSEHDLLPEDELGIAGHLYMIDYDPLAPTQVLAANQVLEEEINPETRKRHSLMELAGLETDYEHTRRPGRAPDRPARPAAEADFDDPLAVAPPVESRADHAAPVVDDEDFFKLIEEDVKKPGKK